MLFSLIYGLFWIIFLVWALSYALVVQWILWGPFERFCINRGMKPTNWNWQNRIVKWLESSIF